jgi:hypothetical protein
MSSSDEEGINHLLLKRLIKTFKYKYEEDLDSGDIVKTSFDSFDEDEQDDLSELIDWMDDYCEEYNLSHQDYDLTCFKYKSMLNNSTVLEIILTDPNGQELLIKIKDC